MQVQLLIVRTPLTSDVPSSVTFSGALICSSNSSSEETMRIAEVASWQHFFSDA